MSRRRAGTVQVSGVKMSETPHVRRDVGLEHFLVFAFFSSAAEALSRAERLVLTRSTNVYLSTMLGAVLAEVGGGNLQVSVHMLKGEATGHMSLSCEHESSRRGHL